MAADPTKLPRRDQDLGEAELAAEIARVRRLIDELEGRPAADSPADLHPTAAPLPEFAIHSMPLANRDRRSYFLFYDVFVHSDRKKLTAVAPYYGEDFDFHAHGVDPEDVRLSVAGLEIRAKRIPYGLDGWEPSILFDFEHPALAKLIESEPELEVAVRAGEAAARFWLDTRPPPAHEISMALCVKDENRWLGLYLEYYLELLRVDHVYVYDNRTRNKRELRALLAPWAARGQVTYIPWNFEWRNRVDRKQIGQPPQESHTLARFGADDWIGFFDADEFLHVPEGDLRGLLAPYDPAEIGAVGTKMLWAMYKGERSFEDLLNPLVECIYAREDANWRKRWKLFVSPQRVRFMRFHWIQEDQQTVHLPEIHYYHYFLRDFRFDEGKGDAGLGANAFLDETLRHVWEDHAGSSLRSGGGPSTSALVGHVQQSLARALREESNLTPEALAVPGMIGVRTRHFYNNLCARPGTRLLEIGAFKGASTCAFLCGNQLEATVIDNWSQFGNHRDLCMGNIERFRGRSKVQVLEEDCWQVDPALLGRYDVYFYDGEHSERSQNRGVVEFEPYLADEAVILVDDWNWERVREGTRRGLEEIGAEVIFSEEITVPEVFDPQRGKILSDPTTWWNGLACFVIRRK